MTFWSPVVCQVQSNMGLKIALQNGYSMPRFDRRKRRTLPSILAVTWSSQTCFHQLSNRFSPYSPDNQYGWKCRGLSLSLAASLSNEFFDVLSDNIVLKDVLSPEKQFSNSKWTCTVVNTDHSIILRSGSKFLSQ